jgi:hypothetical protein
MALQRAEMVWETTDSSAKRFSELGEILSKYGFYETTDGLILVEDGSTTSIKTADQLLPLIYDRVDIYMMTDGKPKASKLTLAEVKPMMKCRSFLDHFKFVDRVTKTPLYLSDFSLTQPGYNAGGEGFRYLYTGEEPNVSNSMTFINDFLDEMAFETQADRANALAGAITCMLHNHWIGGKPIILATATKSHSGKDTVISFCSGQAGSCSISYQPTDWAVERNFVSVIKNNPNDRVVVIENARLDSRTRYIASAYIERFATDPHPYLFSTGTGPATRIKNEYVIAISTNFGLVSEDILNRSLPCHLAPHGSVTDRVSKIGNPKLEYLPMNRENIAAELRGMIQRWVDGGMSLDENARHPFSIWAKQVGGILETSGIESFLGNYDRRRVADDPKRSALAILASEVRDNWLTPNELALIVADLGLTKQLINNNDQESPKSRARGLGKTLSEHSDEEFDADDDGTKVKFKLEKSRRRFEGQGPHIRYRFTVTPIVQQSNAA